MLTIERRVKTIVERMESRKVNGEKFPHGKAFAELLLLSLERLFAKSELRKVQKATCEFCNRHEPHVHHLEYLTQYGSYEIADHRHLQEVLDREFMGVYTVSNPLFGGTYNIKYVGHRNFLDFNVELRCFLKINCGLEILNTKAVQRKVSAVVKIP